MIDRRHPESWEEMKTQKERLDDLFRTGKIGAPTYTVSLGILGFREREAQQELRDRLMEMEK